ncbi:Autophagy-related protein 28 [Metarhizium album ARSEF 1941]|uniref:Autophagy-related protein 28 n=1 Tax=Metarhizium album (strain ARSEF 1941) TaxID=1081103 RepID=A0A0B2WHE7_METAS|nr:Autophagy-related protein 28 [Metarhizium album ARSEF 1941]KHN95441.1 Autophagy-related protein 28 [Metarhizium album ARSEF 1941]
MATTSSPLMDRLNHVALRASNMPLTSPASQTPMEYQLESLEPRPASDKASISEHVSSTVELHATEVPVHSANRPDDPAGSYSKRKPRPMFAGPPPPITSSMPTSSRQSSPMPISRERGWKTNGIARTLGRSIAQAMFDHKTRRDTPYNLQPDSIWRSLRYRKRALETDIQRLLDSQVAGLMSGSQYENSSLAGRDFGVHRDTGSSTPTGTFYSTTTSSRTSRSLYMPLTSTEEGNIIPVRQPANNRSLGLRSARNGLRRAILSLVELHEEEIDKIDTAIEERQSALAQLNRLGTRRLGIQAKLTSVDDDPNEPLGRQLRELDARYKSVQEEIGTLEEKLMSLRNQRRWLREKMDDAKGKRDAGLSGYRGALRDVDSELALLVRRPAFLPLDPAVFGTDGGALCEDIALSGGLDFFCLIPERRTPEMAESWWEAELRILKKQRTQVYNDRQALAKGAVLWEHVVALVSGFEDELRGALNDGIRSTALTSVKGKENAIPERDLIQTQLITLNRVLQELEGAMRQAESQSWNLLICAIGAELEAFREGQSVLEGLLTLSNMEPDDANQSIQTRRASRATDHHGQLEGDSDNAGRPDLLPPNVEGAGQSSTNKSRQDKSRCADTSVDRPQSQDSENEVPLEFLAEHD